MSVDPYLAFVGFYNDWSREMEGDKEFYAALARDAGGPVVELGVGTGRVAIACAQAGVDVIGVDVSEAMMAEGKRRAGDAGVGDRMTWVHADMREFVADPPVRLVTIPFRSFLHMTTAEDQLRTLAGVNRSLVPGGRLALNVFIPDPFVIVDHHGKRNFQAEFVDELGRRCEMYASPIYETGTQLVHLTASCDAYDGDRLVETTQTILEIRMVYRYEMEHLLARSGFLVEAEYGWFDLRPLAADSRELVIVARKP